MSSVVTAESTVSVTSRDEQRAAELSGQLTILAGKITKVDLELKHEEQKLASLTGAYNSSCRKLALGESADPSYFQVEIAQHNAKAAELRQRIQELQDTALPLSQAHYAIGVKVNDQKEFEQIALLEQEQREKVAAVERAHRAWQQACDEDHQARARLDQARRVRELKVQRRARGLA